MIYSQAILQSKLERAIPNACSALSGYLKYKQNINYWARKTRNISLENPQILGLDKPHFVMLKEHVKNKLAFLVGHSAMALTLSLPVSGTKAIYAIFFCIDIQMFLEQANSDMENGFLKKSKIFPWKIHMQQKLETRK